MKKLKIELHTQTIEVRPPYAISDKLLDKLQLRLKGTDLQDITPHGNFLYGNKTGAIWLRICIDQRFGTTEQKAFDILDSIFKTLRN